MSSIPSFVPVPDPVSHRSAWRGHGLRKARALGLAALVGAAGIASAIGFHRPEPPPPAHAAGLTVEDDGFRIAAGAPQWRALKVGEAVEAQARWTDPIPGRVKIDERLASKVGVPVGGRVTRVFAELGQKVRAGDPLFALESHEIAALRTDRLKAEVDLEAADAALERVRAIVAAHALPAKEELAASEERKRAELALRLADARLDSLHLAGADGERPNELVIASPRDGAVVEKTVAPHQVVACDATPLMVVADLSSLWVLADVFETDAVEVSEGAEAEITSPALPNGAIAARVESVSAVVDPVRHTVPIRMEVDNAAGALRPNAYASVRFATRPQPNAVAIPATALVSDGARQHVYVCENGSRFVRRDIVAAATTAGTTTVLSGLAAGESVVVEGAILLDNELASAR